MPRIELWMTLFAGLAGGLAGVLWSGLVTARWRAGSSHAETAARIVAGAVLRGVAGAALGFLFWLGWGLIAVIGRPWYEVGLLYGALAWVALVAPTLGTLLLQGYGPARPVAAHAIEWLFTCSSVGLLCALAWHRYT